MRAVGVVVEAVSDDVERARPQAESLMGVWDARRAGSLP